MYKHVYQVLAAVTLLALAMVPATQAQSFMLKASIPFDFLVGETRLPAGDYHVKSTTQGAMLIQSPNARSSATVLTQPTFAAKISDVGKLVFNQYGDQYFLSKIWVPSSDTGRELPKSRLEREVARNISKPGQTIVTVAQTGKK